MGFKNNIKKTYLGVCIILLPKKLVGNINKIVFFFFLSNLFTFKPNKKKYPASLMANIFSIFCLKFFGKLPYSLKYNCGAKLFNGSLSKKYLKRFFFKKKIKSQLNFKKIYFWFTCNIYLYFFKF